ncbi:hypothetical protein ACSSS7_006915 [Eimeria intestinalis]
MDMQMTFYWGYDATILFSSKLKALCRDVQREPPKEPQALALSGCAPPTVATAAGTTGGVSSSQSPVTTDGERWRAAPPLLQAPLSHSPYSMDAAATWARTPEQGRFETTEQSQSLWRAKSVVVWLLLLLSGIIDWGMMLVCMTFNGGLFLAVVAGVATGQLLLQQRDDRISDCCASAAHG